MKMRRARDPSDRPNGAPMPPWMAGAAIGLAILTMATGAITLGTTLALSQATLPK